MKKVIYIAAFILGLGVVSCQKQDIKPSADPMEAPVWDSGASARPNSGKAARSASEGGTVTGTTTGTGGTSHSSDDGEITDPNLDPDAD